MTASDLWSDVGAIAAFSAVGTVLMLLGYALIDVLTPGKLHELIWERRNRNASILVASNLLAVGLIVVTAIISSHEGLGAGLVSTAVYGVLGLAFMGLTFVVLDLLTPGKLGALVVDENDHPAVWVSAASHLATAGMICAAIY